MKLLFLLCVGLAMAQVQVQIVNPGLAVTDCGSVGLTLDDTFGFNTFTYTSNIAPQTNADFVNAFDVGFFHPGVGAGLTEPLPVAQGTFQATSPFAAEGTGSFILPGDDRTISWVGNCALGGGAEVTCSLEFDVTAGNLGNDNFPNNLMFVIYADFDVNGGANDDLLVLMNNVGDDDFQACIGDPAQRQGGCVAPDFDSLDGMTFLGFNSRGGAFANAGPPFALDNTQNLFAVNGQGVDPANTVYPEATMAFAAGAVVNPVIGLGFLMDNTANSAAIRYSFPLFFDGVCTVLAGNLQGPQYFD